MARPRKVASGNPRAATVKAADAVHDGKGGFYPVGAVIDCADDESLASLKAKGLVD